MTRSVLLPSVTRAWDPREDILILIIPLLIVRVRSEPHVFNARALFGSFNCKLACLETVFKNLVQ